MANDKLECEELFDREQRRPKMRLFETHKFNCASSREIASCFLFAFELPSEVTLVRIILAVHSAVTGLEPTLRTQNLTRKSRDVRLLWSTSSESFRKSICLSEEYSNEDSFDKCSSHVVQSELWMG